jgi:PhnB protein
MSATPVPAHLHSVTPAITCTPCAEAIDFYVRAFGAEETTPRMQGPDGMVAHAEIRIGDSVIMLGDEWPDGPTLSPTSLGGSSAALFIYTDDVRAMWDHAIAAGCERGRREAR